MATIITTRERNLSHTKIEVTGSETSDPYIFDSFNFQPISITAFPATTSSVRVEYSLSASAEIAAGTANWAPWVHGDVSAVTGETISSPVRALRIVSGSGSSVVEFIHR